MEQAYGAHRPLVRNLSLDSSPLEGCQRQRHEKDWTHLQAQMSLPLTKHTSVLHLE